MTSEEYDLIVIGAGSAARAGAEKAATEYGARVAMIERERWGGSCPNVACKPTKAYIVAADLVHDINDVAAVLGIEVGPARANLAKVKARKDELVGTQEAWLERLRDAGYTTVAGEAAFAGPHVVRVGDRMLGAERILVATGSRTAVPPIDGIEEVGWVDHVSALELTEVPERLLVLGCGAVGLELGQVFARFGSRVTMVDEAERPALRADPDASAELAAAFEDERIAVLTPTSVRAVRRDGDDIVATLGPRGADATDTVRVDAILVAAGRVPNVDALDLQAAGVETTKLGIAVDERLRTSAPGIWAAGDVTAVAQFTPIAQYQARIAVDDMFGGNGAAANYHELPTAIFTDPELAQIGLTEQEAGEAGFDVDVVRHPLSALQRARYTDTRRGLYKIVFDRRTRKVLGVHIVARSASDVVQAFAVSLRLGVTIDDVIAAHHAFPTYAEGLKAAAEQARTHVEARGGLA
jgi:mercuric reductase